MKAVNLYVDTLGLLRKDILSQYEYGDGFTILKELLQNANDSGATEMIISYYDGSKGNFAHPPFNLKGLLVYNDGAVSKKDIRGIKSIAMDTKAQNSSTIGKYGLGLKSVFHICESFYFYCHEHKTWDYVNPFFEDGEDKRHPTWLLEPPSTDDEKLTAEIEQSIIGKRDRGITFFFPIDPDETKTVFGDNRKKDIKDEKHPFNQDDCGNRNLLKNLVTATAILNKTTKSTTPLKKISYSMVDEFIECSFDSESNELVVKQGNKKSSFKYSCFRVPFGSNDDLERFIIRRIKSEQLNIEEKKTFENPEVVFEIVRGEKCTQHDGTLNIYHAVSLPLPQTQKNFNQIKDLPIGADYDYSLIIHAPFAIDSGRREFQDSDRIFKDKISLEIKDKIEYGPVKLWNASLYQLAILPNIPKALKNAIDEGVLDANDVSKVVRQIKESFNLNDLFASLLVSKFGLFQKFNVQKDSYEWELVEHEESVQYVSIPNAKKSFVSELYQPIVQEDSCKLIIERVDDYLLGGNNCVVDDDALGMILESFPKNALIQEDYGAYLKTLMELNPLVPNKNDVGRKALMRCKDLLYEMGEDALKYSTSIRSLCSVISECYTTPVYLIRQNTLNKDQWSEIWSAENPCLIIPNETPGKSINEGAFNLYRDKFFSFLLYCSFENRQKHDILFDMIRVSRDQASFIRNKFSNLKIIPVFSLQKKIRLYESYDSLSYAPLFKVEQADAVDENSMPEHLQKLIKDESVFQVSNSDADLWLLNAYICSKGGVLEYLKKNKQHAYSVEYRDVFLNIIFDGTFALYQIPPGEDSFYAFLLSGFNSDALTNGHVAFIEKGLRNPWKSIFDYCNGKSSNPKTLVTLTDNMAEFINNNERILKAENLIRINSKACIELLKNEADLNFLKQEGFVEYREELFKEIDSAELFRKIPLHKDGFDNWSDFKTNENFYNGNDFHFPKDIADLEPKKFLIQPDENQSIRDKQRQKFSDYYWTAGRAICDLLSSCSAKDVTSSKYASWILDLLKDRRISREDRPFIMKYSWIPLKNGLSISPELIVLKEWWEPSKRYDEIKKIINLFDETDVLLTAEECEILKKFIKSDDYVANDELRRIFSVKIKELNGRDYFKIDDFDLWNYAVDVYAETFQVFKICDILKSHFTDNSVFSLYEALWNDNVIDYNVAVNYLNLLTELAYSEESLDLFRVLLPIVAADNQFEAKDVTRYPVQSKKWQTPDKIVQTIYREPGFVSEATGVDKSLKLPADFYKILSATNEVFRSAVMPMESNDVPDNDALKIISSWRDFCTHKNYIDGILYLLGGSFRENSQLNQNIIDCIKNLAKKSGNFLGSTQRWFNADPDQFSDRLDESLKTIDFKNIFDDVRKVVNVSFKSNLSRSQLTKSLIGEEISLSILATDVYEKCSVCLSFAGEKGCDPTHRILSPVIFKHQNEEVDDSVKSLFRSLLVSLYFINIDACKSDYGMLIGAVEQLNQFTIESSRARIQDELFATLRTLNVDYPEFKKLNNQLNQTFNGTSDKRPSELKADLVKCLDSNPEFKTAVFNKVLDKIQQNQYSSESVLFELFQNADDCVNDLVYLAEEDQVRKDFIVENNEISRCLTVSHFGRAINKRCGDEEHNEKFQWDLLNMLSLSSSEKNASDGHSGKFGLGFKSVYTICKEPRVYNDELHFKIVAGLYPEKIEEKFGIPKNETRIELDYDLKCATAAPWNKFKENANFLLIFSKQIDKIQFGKTIYQPKKSLIASFDELNVSLSKVTFDSENYLLVDSNDSNNLYKILFKLDASGNVVSCAEDCRAKIWNLTPLEEQEASRLPFFINSDFQVDTGRLRLAGNGVNASKIKKIATHMAQVVLELDKEYHQWVCQIIDVMYKTFASNDKFFEEFARTILGYAKGTLHLVVSGYGPIINLLEKNELYPIQARIYTNSAESSSGMMLKLQTFVDLLRGPNNKVAVVLDTVSGVYDSIAFSGDRTISSILDLIPEHNVSHEIMKSLMCVVKIFDSRGKLWDHWSNIGVFKFLDKNGNYVAARECEPSIEYGNDIVEFMRSSGKFKFMNFIMDYPFGYFPDLPLGDDDVPDDEKDVSPVSSLANIINDIEGSVCSYYSRIYSTDFYDFSSQKIRESLILEDCSKMNKNWCILLLTAVCQSLSFYNHLESSIRINVDALDKAGIIDAFVNGESLQDLFERYYKITMWEECHLRTFEMLIRLNRCRKYFDTYYGLLESLPQKENFEDIKDFLTPQTDPELENFGIVLPSMERTMKKGVHFLLRELLRNDFWVENTEEELESIQKQAYMPKNKIICLLGASRDCGSIDIYERISKLTEDPTLCGTYDIPFIEA